MPAEPTPARLEAFSDGVIAVIITIMVLDLKVPKADGPHGVLTILPNFAVYLLSFLFTGVYWVNHHHLVDRLKRVDPVVLWSNLAFLFTLSLLPFFTNYLVEKGVNAFPVALYAASLFLDGLTFTLLSWALIRNLSRSPAEPDKDQDQIAAQLAENRKGKLSLAMYLLAVPAAYWSPWTALVLIAAVTLIWIVPTFGVRSPSDASMG